MVQLDHRLLHEARRFMTGANVHQLKEMIFVYVQAVDLHNRDWPSHHEYQLEHEVRLRRYVIEDRLKRLDQTVKQNCSSRQTSEEIDARDQKKWRTEHAA